MDLIFVRHAESETNTRPEEIGGYQPEAPLTSLGRNQAQALGIRLKEEGFAPSEIYIAPAVRTQTTARIALDILGIEFRESMLDDRLRELTQWDWEWKDRREVYTPEIQRQMRDSHGAFCAPNGESQIDAADRMEEWLWSTNASDSPKFVFSHWLAIKCLVQRLIGLPPGTAYMHELANTGIVQLTKKSQGWSLVRWNDHSHIRNIIDV